MNEAKLRLPLFGVVAFEALLAAQADEASPYRAQAYIEGVAQERRRLMNQFLLLYFGAMVVAYLLDVAGTHQQLKVAVAGVQIDGLLATPDFLFVALALLTAYAWMRFSSIMILTILINMLGSTQKSVSGELLAATKDAQFLWSTVFAINRFPFQRAMVSPSAISLASGLFHSVGILMVVLQVGYVWYVAAGFVTAMFDRHVGAALFFLDFASLLVILFAPVLAYGAVLVKVPIALRSADQAGSDAS